LFEDKSSSVTSLHDSTASLNPRIRAAALLSFFHDGHDGDGRLSADGENAIVPSLLTRFLSFPAKDNLDTLFENNVRGRDASLLINTIDRDTRF